MATIPDGFLPLNSPSPFNQLVGPYYARLRDDTLAIGLLLQDKHCNTSGRLHGAMVCAIFDTVIGHNVGLSLVKERGEDLAEYAAGVPGTPLVTTSLTIDYMGTANSGDWVEARAGVQRPGRSIAFADAELYCGETRIAKASGVYRLFS